MSMHVIGIWGDTQKFLDSFPYCSIYRYFDDNVTFHVMRQQQIPNIWITQTGVGDDES